MVLSLLALVFAYDTVAGERERGTLRLVLTHPVRRGHILIAKYMSAMICLLIPVLMSFLLVLILLTLSNSVSLSADDFPRIAGVVFTSLVYLLLFYLIGMLISVAARRTSTALMLSMFVWGFLVRVYPNMILTSIETAPQADTETSAYNQIKRIWEEFEREWNYCCWRCLSWCFCRVRIWRLCALRFDIGRQWLAHLPCIMAPTKWCLHKFDIAINPICIDFPLWKMGRYKYLKNHPSKKPLRIKLMSYNPH